MKRNVRGFTLIELLVVIAIIAILVSILMPSLARAKELAKRAGCLSNQHGIALAMQVYAGDFREHLPPMPHSSGDALNASWSHAIREEGFYYTGDGDTPEAPSDGQGGAWLGMGILILTKHIPNPEVLYCPSQRFPAFQYPTGYTTKAMPIIDNYRHAGYIYRGWGQCRTLVTEDERQFSWKLNVNRRTYAMTRDIAELSALSTTLTPGKPAFDVWPHNQGNYGMHVAWSDGHANWVPVKREDYLRTIGVWNWNQADAYEALMWIGLETNDYSRLRAAFP